MDVNAFSVDDRTDRTNGELYTALIEGRDAKVLEICRGLVNGPLHILTIHRDTVLHIASFNKRNNLVVDLLRSLHANQSERLTWMNSSGNTVLHEMASNDGAFEAVKEILCRAPSLLMMMNNKGESPLFRAARFGRIRIFRFLNAEVQKRIQIVVDSKTFLVRNDKATILHISILNENFELAVQIAKTYPRLIGEEDGEGMTGLQLLACNPSAFDNGVGNNFLKTLIYKYVDSSPERKSRVPMLKEIRKRKRQCRSANELARILIENDNSWKETVSTLSQRGKFHKYKGSTSRNEQDDVASEPLTPYAPLLLATKSGCIEIVKEILRVYPQALEHVDCENGRNILHVAIKYRRKKIIDYILKMPSLKRLRGKIDIKGNSLLHMIGIRAKNRKVKEDTRNPASVLRDDLLLFERVRKKCTNLATLQINSEGQTAEELFMKSNAQLHIDAKEWMKRTAENCTIVAVLIATVAFAAAYTVPGGPNQQTGYPLLKRNPFFIIFALADALSLTFSLTSVIIFLSIHTSSFPLKDFRSSLNNKLLLGLTLLILSVSMMMVAFAATLILTISSGQNWTNFILYIISFFPVTVFVLSYVRLYKLLIEAFAEKLGMVKEAMWPKNGNDFEPPLAMPFM